MLIDLWKDLYVPCLDLIYGKLNAGALVAAGNMTYPDSARADAKAHQRRVHRATSLPRRCDRAPIAATNPPARP